MADLERALERRFREGVKVRGGMVLKITAETGAPDRLAMLPGGRMELVELKTETGGLRPAQKMWHDEARTKCGIVVTVLYGADAVDAWLDNRFTATPDPVWLSN